MDFADRIKQLRAIRGLTQDELGNLIGVSKQSISGWETRQYSPPLAKIPDIANTLGVNIDWILGVSPIMLPRELEELDDIKRSLDETYYQLNSEGQKKVLSYAVDLQASGKYDREPVEEKKVIEFNPVDEEPDEYDLDTIQFAAYGGEELTDEQKLEALKARDEFQTKQKKNKK